VQDKHTEQPANLSVQSPATPQSWHRGSGTQITSFEDMPDVIYKFYYRLGQYYDDPKLMGMPIDDVVPMPAHKKFESRFKDTLEAARSLSLPYTEHDAVLLSCDPRDLRMALLYRLGYYPAEINAVFGDKSRYFRRDGSGKVGPLLIDEAVKVAPVLEVDPLLLLDLYDQEKTYHSPVAHIPWFKMPLVSEVSVDDLVASCASTGNHVRSGGMLLDELGTYVGVVLIRWEDFAEISFTVEQPAAVIDAQWDMRLFKLANQLGIKGPAVYTVSAPFLDRSKIRIHRLSFPRTTFPLTRFRVYTRILSPRTEEAIFYKQGKFAVYKFPQMRAKRTAIAAAVHGLWEPLIMKRPEEAVHCPWKQYQAEKNA
jgi:hypothetical protein